MANPVLRPSVYQKADGSIITTDAMTVTGAANKTLLLVFLCALTAGLTWSSIMNSPEARVNLLPGVLIGSAIGGFIIAMITTFVPRSSPFTAPLYAVLEGVVLGSISLMYERLYNGIIFQAVLLTFGILFSLLFLYRARVIRVTDRFRSGVIIATAGVFFAYMATWILGMFGMHIPFLHQSGPIGIVISLAIIAIASANLLLDFDFIERAAASRAPAYMEWYSGFGILVTLVWLYMEILRFLGQMKRR